MNERYLSMPSLFVSHGSPMLALEDAPTTKFLRGLSVCLPKPSAIIVTSAHWETPHPMLTGALKPETIHDFYGFPKELYDLRYPASGSPALAKKVQDMFVDAGVQAGVDAERGLDHGAWNPLLLMYPLADIPVVELSVQPNYDAKYHHKIGQILAPLRAENILIIGTGNLTHNLREAFRGNHKTTPIWVLEFADWVAKKLAQGDIESLLDWENSAPHALKNHPTPEHFMPFFVALGAGGLPLLAKRLHDETALGVLAMDAYSFGG